MECTPHILLAGAGADEFCREMKVLFFIFFPSPVCVLTAHIPGGNRRKLVLRYSSSRRAAVTSRATRSCSDKPLQTVGSGPASLLALSYNSSTTRLRRILRCRHIRSPLRRHPYTPIRRLAQSDAVRLSLSLSLRTVHLRPSRIVTLQFSSALVARSDRISMPRSLWQFSGRYQCVFALIHAVSSFCPSVHSVLL